MDAMDIIRPVGDRKRSWGEEEYEPPKKRTPHRWIHERPPATELDYPIIQQVQNIALGTYTQENDVPMITDEPERQRPMFLPPSPISRPTSPPPAIHNTPTTFPPINPIGVSTQPMATATDSIRPLDSTLISFKTKRRFAIGPRADCEKCLAREPGHYGHWL
ncbi:hypothetical protein OPQ81_007068 [Rhizoctonia solani]|nr:hypothetical protein OPQ81_007068 [Rhizoctonia solani]